MAKASTYPAAEFDANTRLLGVNGSGLLKQFDPADLPSVTNTDSITLALSDKGMVVELNKATAVTVTVPPNSSVAFPVGSYIDFEQYGAGQVSFAAGSGVTIRSADGFLSLRAQYSAATLRKRATDEWVLVGDLA